MLKRHFLILTIFAAALHFWPSVHYQPILSQEDHGRDLYTFAQIAHGKHIYKDMWWEYGPLMPYYYALFNITFGLKITSVLLGKFILNILGSLFFYLASCEVMSAPWAFLAACFFMQEQQDFFYTYNHIGGIVLFLALLWMILLYIHQKNPRNIYWALGIALLIGFIKINFGVSALAATLLSVSFADSRLRGNNTRDSLKIFYISGLFVVPLIWFGVYYCLLSGLTMTEIGQCLPYFGNNHNVTVSPLQSIQGYWLQNNINFINDWLALLNQLLTSLSLLSTSVYLLRLTVYPLFFATLIAVLGLAFRREFKYKRREFWLILCVVWIFIILNFHEFMVSNTWYRSFWAQPFILFFLFFILFTTVSHFPKKWRYWAGGFFIAFFITSTVNEWITTKNSSTADKFLTASSGQIYVGNKTEWVNTFNTVTVFLNKALKKDELFLALPCDSLFYYLTDKPSPTRQTIFFNANHITPQQENSVIQDLKRKNVQYILLSNRIKHPSPELGEFGKTYCPLLYQYVMSNFKPFFRYGGNWEKPAGWASNHGVVLLKKGTH